MANARCPLQSLLCDTAFELPASVCKDECFERSLEKLCGSFSAALEQLECSSPSAAAAKSAVPKLKSNASGLMEAIREFLAGRTWKARQAFQAVMSSADSAIDGLLTDPTSPPRNCDQYFRLRIEPSSSILTRRDIFHLPLEKRHKIKAQRYSAPGLPCLYLGNSYFTCWNEMNRPSDADCWLSVFQLREHSKWSWLNFTWTPRALSWWVGHLPSTGSSPDVFIRSYCEMFPLLAACSFRRRSVDSDANFHVEHIVPQLLLSWIVEHDRRDSGKRILGVRYFSTLHRPCAQAEVEKMACLVSTNYAAPARNFHTTGFCDDLASAFELTSPVNVAFQLGIQGHSAEIRFYQTEHLAIPIGGGRAVPYANTHFENVELAYFRFHTNDAQNRAVLPMQFGQVHDPE